MIDIEKLEDLPKKQGIKGKVGDPEHYRDHYSVPWNRVNRWLRSKLGQNWDKVISEYVKLPYLSAREKTHRFLADNFVEENTHIVNNVIYYRPRFPHGQDSVHGRKVKQEYYDIFYVHPVTKLLCFSPKFHPVYKEKEKTLHILGDYHQLIKLNGIWYEIKGHSIGENNPDKRMLDENGRNTTSCYPYDGISNYVKIIYKKELNSKELKKFGLKNDVLPVRYGRLKY